jgi:formate dehydrogenase maturation protein FdhE
MDAAQRREVEKHRQCPICYHGPLNGVGTAYATRAPTTHYKCDRCGHTWSAVISRTVTVTHRDVVVETRTDPPAVPAAGATPKRRKASP